MSDDDNSVGCYSRNAGFYSDIARGSARDSEEVVMDARERAEKVCDQIFVIGESVSVRASVDVVERAIAEAIEEEREACAKILDEEVEELNGLGRDYKARGLLERANVAFVSASQANRIGKRIRARSNVT